VNLSSLFDIAAEEYRARRPDQAQPGALGGIELCSGETNKQQLTDVVAQAHSHLW
jgi:hypothetical protein